MVYNPLVIVVGLPLHSQSHQYVMTVILNKSNCKNNEEQFNMETAEHPSHTVIRVLVEHNQTEVFGIDILMIFLGSDKILIPAHSFLHELVTPPRAKVQ